MLLPQDLTFREGEDVNVKPGEKEVPLGKEAGKKYWRNVTWAKIKITVRKEDKRKEKEGRKAKRERG